MPLLDFATPQPSFRNHLYSIRFPKVYRHSFLFCNENATRLRSSWTCFRIPEKANGSINIGSFWAWRGGGLMIKAVATLEPRCFNKKNDDVQQLGADSTSLPDSENQSSSDDLSNLDEREKLRRIRISKANKGNTPWNKGRKHSPETLQLIRERTRIAMQNPKVKMKLVNLGRGHSPSDETRIKIGEGVRLGWERRREKLMVQETCHFEWLNLIAEASRKGLCGEKELQWDSYNILDQQLNKEWIESIELRKKNRPKGGRRAPLTPERRRKLSETISAKWADPSYRNRVYAGLSKYHGTSVGAKPRRRVRSDGELKKRSPSKKSNGLDRSSGKSASQRSNMPTYKDPQASSKLKMIKRVRAQRAAADSMKTKAIKRARLLISEAERAAEALEIAAAESPVAQASLIETKKLIAEAIRSIESIESGDLTAPDMEKESDKDPSQMEHRGVNGVRSIGLSDAEIMDFGFSKLDLQDDDDLLHTSLHEHGSVNGKVHLPPTSNDLGLLPLDMNSFAYELDEELGPDEIESHSIEKEETRTNNTSKNTKRWVRGKLVEVDEDD